MTEQEHAPVAYTVAYHWSADELGSTGLVYCILDYSGIRFPAVARAKQEDITSGSIGAGVIQHEFFTVLRPPANQSLVCQIQAWPR